MRNRSPDESGQGWTTNAAGPTLASHNKPNAKDRLMGKQRKPLQRLLLSDSDRKCRVRRAPGVASVAWIRRSETRQQLNRKLGNSDVIQKRRLGSQTKPYQVRQARAVLLEYRLGGQDDAEV